jgi:hypothetical membrane protein
MPGKVNYNMEVYFGLFGAITTAVCIILAAFLTPDYDPRIYYISDLGYLEFKSLFSIGFVIGGSLGIPFFIYLERELINIRESIRRLATGASIFTSVCIALVGIIPDESYLEIFLIFHNLVASVAFLGSCTYITLYSYLMYMGPKVKLYEGPQFKKVLAYYGFSINIPLILFYITWSSLIEWILFFFIFGWVIATAITLLEFRFFNLAGVYYRRSKYPEALERFEEARDILNKLNLVNDPISKTIEENIEYLKNKVEKKK